MSSVIQSFLSAAVLKDCADRLDILGHLLSVQMSRDRDITPAQEKNKQGIPTIHCRSITQKIHIVCSELQEGTFSPFQDAEEEEIKQKEQAKKKEEETMVKQRKLAVERQQQEIKDKNELVQKKEFILETLRSQTVTMKIEQKQTELCKTISQQILTETWQKAQLIDQLGLLQKQLEEEKRFYEKTEKFLQIQHEELEQKLHTWKQQTQQMQQEKQGRFDNLGCKRTLKKDRLMDMKRKFREKEQVVIEYRVEQEKLRQKEAKDRAASKIQAWWRRCMARRGLGASRKTEESKKSKKKKKGSKKE